MRTDHPDRRSDQDNFLSGDGQAQWVWSLLDTRPFPSLFPVLFVPVPPSRHRKPLLSANGKKRDRRSGRQRMLLAHHPELARTDIDETLCIDRTVTFFFLLRPQKFAAEQDKMGGGGRPWLSRHAVCPSRRFNIRFPLTAKKKQNTAEMINVTIIFYLSAMKF